MGTILAMIYQDILEFHREALAYFKQRSVLYVLKTRQLTIFDNEKSRCGEWYFKQLEVISVPE